MRGFNLAVCRRRRSEDRCRARGGRGRTFADRQGVHHHRAHSGDGERPIQLIVNTGSGDHEHPLARPERGWRAVGRHSGLLPLTVVPSHFSLVFVKPAGIRRGRYAATNVSPLFDAARRARCVDMSGRPSSRPHSSAAERRAGQRRRALSGAAGAEPRAENRCLPIFEHGEHRPFDVPEPRGIFPWVHPLDAAALSPGTLTLRRLRRLGPFNSIRCAR